MQLADKKKNVINASKITSRHCEYLLSIFFPMHFSITRRIICFHCNIVFHCVFALICYYCAGFTVHFIFYCDN